MSIPRSEAGRSQRGFTLMEVVITVFLLAVVILITLPNLRTLAGKSRVMDATRQLQASLQLARMKSINERIDHVLVFSTRGWNIFKDSNKNGTRDTGESWLAVTESRLPPGIHFKYPAGYNVDAVNSTGCKCVRFQSNGTMVVASSLTTSQLLAMGDGTDYRQLTVSAAGALKQQRWDVVRKVWL